MHDLHAKILKKVFALLPEEIEIKEIKYDRDSLNEIVLGVKIELEPLFALALFYNSKYARNPGFYVNYIKGWAREGNNKMNKKTTLKFKL